MYPQVETVEEACTKEFQKLLQKITPEKKKKKITPCRRVPTALAEDPRSFLAPTSRKSKPPGTPVQGTQCPIPVSVDTQIHTPILTYKHIFQNQRNLKEKKIMELIKRENVLEKFFVKKKKKSSLKAIMNTLISFLGNCTWFGRVPQACAWGA